MSAGGGILFTVAVLPFFQPFIDKYGGFKQKADFGEM